jgi:hypothetical protein
VNNIVSLADMFQLLTYVPFTSSDEAKKWLTEKGFKPRETKLGTQWVLQKAADMRLFGSMTRVKGAIIARIHEVTPVEDLEFKPV